MKQRLPQRDAERELITRRRDHLRGVLLGRHVRRRAGERAILCDDVVGEAEVGDRDASAAIDQHVTRLEVAMDEPDGVGGFESASGCDEPPQDLRHGRIRSEGLAERDAVDELHRQIHATVDVAGVVDGDHVWIGEPRQRLCLLNELCAVAEMLVVEDLERDVAIELAVVRGVYGAHAAPPDHRQDAIATDRVTDDESARRSLQLAHVDGRVARRI